MMEISFTPEQKMAVVGDAFRVLAEKGWNPHVFAEINHKGKDGMKIMAALKVGAQINGVPSAISLHIQQNFFERTGMVFRQFELVPNRSQDEVLIELMSLGTFYCTQTVGYPKR